MKGINKMGRRNNNIVFHSFYCMKCGNKSYDLPRKKGGQKVKFHRKKMYCPHCKLTVNHVECRDDAEVFEFKQDFEEGLFEDEVKESLEFLQGAM